MAKEKVQTTTYVDTDGNLHVGTDASSVMVPNATARAVVAANFGTGIIAYTPGFQSMWQLKEDGTWADI